MIFMIRKLKMFTIVSLMIFTTLNFGFVASAAPIKVAFIGASNTTGYGSANPATGAYPIRAGTLLGAGYEVRNFAVNGTTMLKQADSPYWNTSQFTDSKAWNPDIVVIMLGANDTKPQNWQYNASFVSTYVEMINIYKNLSSHPRIFLNNEAKVYGAGNFGITDPIVQQVNALIAQVASSTASPLTDVYTVTSGMPQNFPDNVHMNDAAAQVVANAVYPKLITAAIPGKIEAESFTSMNGIQTETTADTGGGLNVGWTDTGDWLNYTVNVQSSGTYTVGFRVASINPASQLQLRNAAGTILTTVNVPNTGGWQTWTTVNATVSLPAGSQTLRVYVSNAGFNLNWLNFTASGTSSATFYPNSNYGGTGISLGVGTYTISQMVAAGIPNDAISSIKVPAGRTVIAYGDGAFDGPSWTFTADNSNLANTGNDNTISSIKIQ
jgi:lysophospholipase L1-like esterase